MQVQKNGGDLEPALFSLFTRLVFKVVLHSGIYQHLQLSTGGSSLYLGAPGGADEFGGRVGSDGRCNPLFGRTTLNPLSSAVGGAPWPVNFVQKLDDTDRIVGRTTADSVSCSVAIAACGAPGCGTM